MNTKKFNTTLQKLNDLFSAVSRNPGEISSIERDLVRNYLTRLYELSIEEYKAKQKTAKKSKKDSANLNEPEMVSMPSAIITAPEPTVGEEDIVEEIKKVPEKEIPVDPELEELFSELEVKDLSDKLSLSPVKDLAKGMGINEKIFTIQELFGGDQEAFDSTLKDLNRLENFEDAKSLLISGVASKYNWPSKGNKKKAANFIRFIRRKYVK